MLGLFVGRRLGSFDGMGVSSTDVGKGEGRLLGFAVVGSGVGLFDGMSLTSSSISVGKGVGRGVTRLVGLVDGMGVSSGLVGEGVTGIGVTGWFVGRLVGVSDGGAGSHCMPVGEVITGLGVGNNSAGSSGKLSPSLKIGETKFTSPMCAIALLAIKKST